jgi:hypothetical protein
MARGKFEGSRYDNDRGVKEGSPADRKRDAAEKARRMRAMKGKKGKR